jgi:hypothetical protein
MISAQRPYLLARTHRSTVRSPQSAARPERVARRGSRDRVIDGVFFGAPMGFTPTSHNFE